MLKPYTPEQMQQVNKAYYKLTKKCAAERIVEVVKDKECEALQLLVMAPRHDAWGKCIYEALGDMANNSDLLVSALLMMGPLDVHKVKLCYKIRFNNSLEHDIREKVTENSFWEKLLLAWLKRDEPAYVGKRYNAKQEAKDLLLATLGIGTNEKVYVDILSKTIPEEFAQISNEFEIVSTRGIPEAKKSEMQEMEAMLQSMRQDPKLKYQTAVANLKEEERAKLDAYMKSKSSKKFMDVIDSEFSDKSLDNYAAKLACLSMLNYQEAISFIMDHSFNEAAEYQAAQKGVDKPMMNYLISVFRD